jgi:hypothetical protein
MEITQDNTGQVCVSLLRKEIQDKINANVREIERLRTDNSELAIKNMLLCDETQHFVMTGLQ